VNNLVDAGSQKCLDVPSVVPADTDVQVASSGSTVAIRTCNNTSAQVWGWNTNGAILPGGASAGANCNYGAVLYLNFGFCYWEAHGIQQQPFTATGLSVNMGQANPTVPKYDSADGSSHSLMEVWAGGGTSSGSGGSVILGDTPPDTVEFGWIKHGEGEQPHLFATAWQNNTLICNPDTEAQAESCGFVSAGNSVKVGSVVTAGATGTYKIVHASNQWQFWYNGTEVGYYPQSVWTSRGDNSFTSLTYVDIFGEVAVPYALTSKVQMGNGILGSSPGSTAFSSYSLIGSSTAPNLTFDAGSQPQAAWQYAYDRGNTSANGFSVGGPGL
jgi:hypothetical protein